MKTAITELDKAVARWVHAKREQILREDIKGDLEAEVRKQERDVEDEIHTELEKSGNSAALQPFCNICGWRKGGVDSWDGKRCKCRADA